MTGSSDQMPEMPELPEMNDAVLDCDQLAALFNDYRACVTLHEIIVKTGPGLVGDHQPPSLEQAETLLVNRSVRGLQVRYTYQQRPWWDTLMPVEGGVRLVRIQQPVPDA